MTGFELTAEQVEAVEAEPSSQLLVAGAGTGKTTARPRRPPPARR